MKNLNLNSPETDSLVDSSRLFYLLKNVTSHLFHIRYVIAVIRNHPMEFVHEITLPEAK